MAAPTTAARQQELERRYLANQARKNSNRKHVPQLSISDDSHHVTEAIYSGYYDDESSSMPTDTSPSTSASPTAEQLQPQPQPQSPSQLLSSIGKDVRPLSYMNGPSERESFEARRARRHGTLIDSTSSPNSSSGSPTAIRTQSNERVASPSESNGGVPSPKSLQRMSSLGTESVNSTVTVSPPPLSRQTSSETAVQHFPLNDIDYESSPEAVKQELSNLNALRRMSMNIDAADPDLPSFTNIPNVAPKHSDDDEDDPSKLFWVPARLHPELAPKEFKTFIEDRVEKIRRSSGGEDSLSPEGLERSGSGGSNSSLMRKKSMLSHQIDTKGNYEDGAERLERKRSEGMQFEGQATVANLSDLETLVNDPAQLMRRMSLDNARRSQDSNDGGSNEDMPILPPVGTLKRSTRTTYRRGSLKKGERVPFSKRAQQRHDGLESEERPVSPPLDPPTLGLTRVQTEPAPSPSEPRENFSRSSAKGPNNRLGTSQSSDNLPAEQEGRAITSLPTATQEEPEQEYYYESHDQPPSHPPESAQQPRKFHSRIASSGRTTAQLPGYNNTNPLPNIIETLPDGTKVPVNDLIQNLPERKSSHEIPRQFQRGGAHLRPVPGREKQHSLDDISSNPSPLPGSGNTRTDVLTLVPTFEEKKPDKKDATRKSSWKWILGNDDDKEKKSKDDAESSKFKSSKLSKPSGSTEKARLDVLQNSIDGTVPARGRESLVLNREDVKLDDERKKESSKKSESKKEKDKDTGLLAAIFGGKKKTSDSDLKERKRRSDRGHSPGPPLRILKPDIDYNWTRFSILEERAIYRMAHIKLANPRRALYSQVLLSNFMYSYLAKVQMMHPQIQIPAAQRAAQQKNQRSGEQQHQIPEYNQYQRWQEQQAREQAAQQASDSSSRTSFDMIHAGSSGTDQQSQWGNYDDQQTSSEYNDRSSQEFGGRQSYPSSSSSSSRQDARSSNGAGSGSGYSVASTHDYLGYSNRQQGLWDDEDKGEELW